MSEHRSAERNYTIDVMIAIGIIMVVIGHSYQPPFWYFPAYSFHMALFFFASGCLAKSADSLGDRIRIIKAKTKSQLIPYFGYNTLFFSITYFASLIGIRVPGNIPSFDGIGATTATLTAFFWQPFVDGHQLYLYSPAWFLVTLFLVNVTFQIISFSANIAVQWSIYLLAIANMAIWMNYNQSEPSQLSTFVTRTSFGLGFFLTGNLYSHYKTKIDSFILKEYTPIACLLAWNILANIAGPGKMAYAVVWGRMEYSSATLILSASMLAVIFTIWIANATTQLIQRPRIISAVAKNSFYIMVFHLTGFTILNQVMHLAGYVNSDKLKVQFYMYEPSNTWPLYLLFGIGIPIGIGTLIQRAKSGRKTSSILLHTKVAT